MPGANEENIEKCIANLRSIELKGLSSYLARTEAEQLLHDESSNNSQFRSFESCLQRVLDDCLINLGQSISWTKTPHYACSCNVEKIWRVLRLLPKTDIVELVETQNNVEVSKRTGILHTIITIFVMFLNTPCLVYRGLFYSRNYLAIVPLMLLLSPTCFYCFSLNVSFVGRNITLPRMR